MNKTSWVRHVGYQLWDIIWFSIYQQVSVLRTKSKLSSRMWATLQPLASAFYDAIAFIICMQMFNHKKICIRSMRNAKGFIQMWMPSHWNSTKYMIFFILTGGNITSESYNLYLSIRLAITPVRLSSSSPPASSAFISHHRFESESFFLAGGSNLPQVALWSSLMTFAREPRTTKVGRIFLHPRVKRLWVCRLAPNWLETSQSQLLWWRCWCFWNCSPYFFLFSSFRLNLYANVVFGPNKVWGFSRTMLVKFLRA